MHGKVDLRLPQSHRLVLKIVRRSSHCENPSEVTKGSPSLRYLYTPRSKIESGTLVEKLSLLSLSSLTTIFSCVRSLPVINSWCFPDTERSALSGCTNTSSFFFKKHERDFDKSKPTACKLEHQSRAHRHRRAQNLARLERALWRHRRVSMEDPTKRGAQNFKIGNDKVATFKTISERFNTELNKSSAGATIASLTYKEGRVTLYIKPDTQLFNVKMADEIARALRIKPDRPNTGELVDIDKVAFHNVDSIFMTCDQAKSNTFIDNREQRRFWRARHSTTKVEVTSFEASNPTPFHAPVGQLTFSIQDKLGNKLPVKKLFCRLSINDECLRRKNISSDTDGNSTAR